MVNALIKIKNPKAQAIYKTLKNKREAIEYLLEKSLNDKEFLEKYVDKDLLEFFIHKLDKKAIDDDKQNNLSNNSEDDTEVAF